MLLLGKIKVKVGAVVAPTVRQVSVNEKTSGKVHKFADGSKGVSVGQSEYDWSLTCSLEADKQELLDIIDAAKVRGVLPSMTFEVGGRIHMITDCVVTSTGMSSDSDGTADLTIGGISPELIRVR